MDKLVPVVCVIVGGGMATIWYLSSNNIITWFGEYKFGAELIIYNALLSFIGLYIISNKVKEGRGY